MTYSDQFSARLNLPVLGIDYPGKICWHSVLFSSAGTPSTEHELVQAMNAMAKAFETTGLTAVGCRVREDVKPHGTTLRFELIQDKEPK